jgi:predicted dehydrogenase
MKMMIRFLLTLTILAVMGLVGWRVPQAAEPSPLRIGMIGLDTSHVIQFTQLFNNASRPDHVPGGRVVAAFKGGSPDVEASATRVDKYTAELRDKWNVEIVDSIEELCRKVDAVLLMSVDGRAHLKQVRPVFAAKKRVFIDKPFAGSLQDAREIVRLARASGTPFFSSSSLRFVPELQALKRDAKLGGILGAATYGPSPTEPHHPDLFWYGIHAVEMLYTLMGPGCESVTRVHTDGTDVVVGRWKDGHVGTVRGIREGSAQYGAVVFGRKAVLALNPPMKVDYRGLVVEIMKFFQTGMPPVSPEETLEMMAFMYAADVSKTQQGTAVTLKDLDH